MQRRAFLTLAGSLCATASLVTLPARADEGVVVIANTPLRGVDAEAIKRIYGGRMVELDGQPLRPVQLTAGQPLRRRFASAVLQQSDEDFIAYWTVRRYIGRAHPRASWAAAPRSSPTSSTRPARSATSTPPISSPT